MKPTIFVPSSLITPLLMASALGMTTGCASQDPAAPVTTGAESGRVVTGEAGAEITLALGEIAEVSSANLRVRFTRLVGDSRCPTGTSIQCVWAGSVVVEVQAGPIVGFQYIDLRRLESVPGKDTTTVAGQPIRLVRVLPERTSNDAIPVQNYRIVLQVGAAR
jgi:hypothetical protein